MVLNALMRPEELPRNSCLTAEAPHVISSDWLCMKQFTGTLLVSLMMRTSPSCWAQVKMAAHVISDWFSAWFAGITRQTFRVEKAQMFLKIIMVR